MAATSASAPGGPAAALSGAATKHADSSFKVETKHGNPKADSPVAAVVDGLASGGAAAALAEASAAKLTVAGDAVHVVVQASNSAQAQASVVASGARVTATAGKLISVVATPAELAALLGAPGIAYVRAPMPHAEEAVTGEGVASTNASAIQLAGNTGTGVKIAVVDFGFKGLAAAQTSGDIGAVTTVNYCPTDGLDYTNHGTAVTEIVHEMAPGADLTLICVEDEVTLANAETYAKANGIKIVSHSIDWFNTSRGDGSGGAGSPDATVADAAANGILWVNAAGNYAQSHWSGTFVDNGYGVNVFAPNDVGDSFYLPADAGTCAFLKWDSWPATAQDYDLYIVRSADSSIMAASITTQNGSQPPVEAACYTNTTGTSQWFFIGIAKFSATATPRFDLFVDGPQLEYQVAAGSIAEPASAPGAFAVGAACWQGTAIEPFSSRGPTIDGRIKPDLTGPDQVSTTTYGAFAGCSPWTGFAGTSAATPHVAGAAALILSANPTLSPAQLKFSLEGGAQDLGAGGFDNVYGYGLLYLHLPPAAPTNVVGIGYDTAALISWQAPSGSDSWAYIYTVTSAPEGRTCTTAGTLSCAVGGLTNGHDYTFTVTATNSGGTGPASVASAIVTPTALAGATYTPLPPVRLLDTRYGNGLAGGVPAKVLANTPLTFQVTGRGGVPDGATAVTGNVTVVNQTFSWAVYLGPIPIASPSSSTVNFNVGEVKANGLSVALGAGGTLSATYISVAGNTTDLVFDVTGYFSSDAGGSTYHPLDPVRLLDSRYDNGYNGQLTANVPATFQVAGRASVPMSAVAVTGNVTVVNSTAGWAVYLGPDPLAAPTTSTINFTKGQIKANGLTVALSSGGQLSATFISTAGNKTDLVFDVTGYYTADATGAKYVPVTPSRLVDTRYVNGLEGNVPANTPRTFQVTGRGCVPSNATGLTGNVTIVGSTFSWAVFVGPVPTASPGSSTINFNKGEVVANGLTVALGAGGTLSATYMSMAGNTTDLVFDVTGYFIPPAP